MAQVLAFSKRICHPLPHLISVKAVEAVALDDTGRNPLPEKDMLKRNLNGGGASAGRTSHSDYWMFLRHVSLLHKVGP
jgi:hypothetical protein